MQHLGLVAGRVKELFASGADDGREEVQREGRVAGEEDVEEAGYFAEGGDVVGVHGERAGEGEEGLGGGEVVPELGVVEVEDGGDEVELGDGRGEGGEHEVADVEEGEAGEGGELEVWGEQEEEDLGDVVVALEVAEVGVGAEEGDDEGGEEGLLVGELGGGLVVGVVDEGAVDVELDLVLVFVGREGFPGGWGGVRGRPVGVGRVMAGWEAEEYWPCGSEFVYLTHSTCPERALTGLLADAVGQEAAWRLCKRPQSDQVPFPACLENESLLLFVVLVKRSLHVVVHLFVQPIVHIAVFLAGADAGVL